MHDAINLSVGLVGAILVGIYSWSRFDEPSYNMQSEHFARYEPRFATSRKLYTRAKWAYIIAVILIYVTLSAIPDVFTVLAGRPVAEKVGSAFPLTVALVIVTLQNFPGVKDLEQRIRGFLHATARIPDDVRRTVAQMRGAPYTIRPEIAAAHARKIRSMLASNAPEPAVLEKLIMDDEVLQTLSRIVGLLIPLSDSYSAHSGIDPLFFEHYKDELDNINGRCAALSERISAYVARIRSDAAYPEDTALFRDLRDVRDRLYTFIACGVHSSAATNAERFEILRKLGFGLSHPVNAIDMTPLFWMSFASLMVLSIFSGSAVQLFRDRVVSPLDLAWRSALPVPSLPIEIYAWTWSSAAFYLLTIFGALLVRNTRVANRTWFDLNNLERDRPILRYVAPILVGTIFGSAMLTAIAFVGGPTFKASFDSVGQFGVAIGAAVRQTHPWYPLAIVMAVIAVALSDMQFADERFWLRKAVVNALLGGAIMTVVGDIAAYYAISMALADHAVEKGLGAPPPQSKTREPISAYLSRCKSV